MSERISVTISAVDGASKTFSAIGNSAAKMGDQIEQAGTEGTQGLKTIDTQAKSTAQSMDDIKAKATALGAAFGTLLSAAALLGANYKDQQRQVDGINRTYGDQADVILEVTEQIQDLTKFSNDAARESALLGTALVDAYGLSADQVGVLIERSADLAQIYGLELPDAFARLSGAIRGEGEAAERLGLNMSDAAVAAAALDAGITDWASPGAMSEAEKAAFRYQLALEQTAQTVGAAADAADTAGGGFRQFVNAVDDAAESIGGFLGPIGEVAAEMAPLAIAVPVVGAAMGNLGTAFLGTAVGARALSLALSPLAGGMIAIGAALGAGVLAWKIYSDALSTAGGELESFSAAAEQARLNNDPAGAAAFETAAIKINEYKDALADLAEQRRGSSGSPPFPLPSGTQWEAANDAMLAALSDSRVDQQEYLDWVDEQWAAAFAVLADPALYAENIDIIPETLQRIKDVDLSQFVVEAEAATEALTGLAAAAEQLGVSVGAINASGIAMYGQVPAAIAANKEYAELTKNVEAFEDATQAFIGNGDNILDFWLEYQNQLEATGQGIYSVGQASFDTQADLDAWNQKLADAAAFRGMVGIADDINDAGDALDGVLATFQQIDSIGQRSASAGSIADNLIGEPGVWATIDDMLANMLAVADTQQEITDAQELYNNATAAGLVIQESNARVQQDLNQIRAAQLPLLAEAQVAYEANIDRISRMGAEEQRLTLALQDSAMQQQIAAQYATAYSASLGEIPEEVATRMIVEAAEADPMLKEILLNLGLISETEGVISVSFPDGPTVQEAIIGLTESLDQLFTLISGGDHVVHLGIQDDATPVIADAVAQVVQWDDTQSEADLTANNSQAISATSQAQSAANNYDATSASADLNANDNASGIIGQVRGLLLGLDGQTATTYVRTVYETIGSRPPQGVSGPTIRHGGMPGFAHGGTVVPFWGAEAGPEMMHFAGGGTMPIYGEGVHFAPSNTYVSPANANPGLSSGGMTVAPVFNNYAPIYGVDDLNNRFRDFSVTLADELNRQRTAAGMV